MVDSPAQEAVYPAEIWDGTTPNRSRLDAKKNVNGQDWWKLIAEVRSTQTVLTQVAALASANWLDSVKNRFDPTAALPVGPSDEDRYLATATANGWTADNVYEWNATTVTWDETVPIEGTAVWVDDENKIYMYEDGTWKKIAATISHGSLLNLTSADDHTQYVHLGNARTITAKHTFAPGIAQVPFDLGVNAQGELVTGLNADQLDGNHAVAFETAGTMTTHESTYDHTNIHEKDKDGYLDFGGGDQVSATEIRTHIDSGANPHGVTKAQVSLGNVLDAIQLVAANDLSDVADAATARANIGAVGGSLISGNLIYATGISAVDDIVGVTWDGANILTFATGKYLVLPTGASDYPIRFGTATDYSLRMNGTTIYLRFGDVNNIVTFQKDNQVNFKIGGNNILTVDTTDTRVWQGWLRIPGGVKTATALRFGSAANTGVYGGVSAVGMTIIGKADLELQQKQLVLDLDKFDGSGALEVFKISAVTSNFFQTELKNGNVLKLGSFTGTAAAGMVRWDGSNLQVYNGSAWVGMDTHALGGSEHTADTLTNLMAKISDASLVFVATVGTSQDYTTLEAAVDAFEASVAPVGHFIITSNISISSIKALTKPCVLEGTNADRPVLTIAADLSLGVDADANVFVFKSLRVVATTGGITPKGRDRIEFSHCKVETQRNNGVVELSEHDAGTYVRFNGCDLDAASANNALVRSNFGNTSFVSVVDCFEDGPAAGSYLVSTANGNVNLHINATTFAIMGVLCGSSPFVDYRLDRGSRLPTTLFAGTVARIRNSSGYVERGLTLGSTGEVPIAQADGSLAMGNPAPAAHAPAHERSGGDEIPWSEANEPTGFPNLTDTTISWVDGTKTFTIAPTGADFDVWVHAKKYTKTTETLVGDGTDFTIAEGSWYFYYDDTGTLQASQTPFDFMQHATVAHMHWDATNSKAIQFNEERHTVVMPNATMEFLHNTFGVAYISGLGLTPGTTPIPGDGSVDADAEIELSDGVLLDEDLTVDPHDAGGSTRFRQDLTPISQIPVFHRETAPGVWRKKTANNFPVQEGPGAGNDRLQWNDPDAGGAGVWGLSEVGDGEYVAVFVACIPDLAEPIFAILGQETHATLQDAEDNNNYADLALGDEAFREQRILYRIIFKTDDAYANTPKAFVADIVDMRAAQLGSAAGTIIPSVHNAMSGRDAASAHPASSIAMTTGSFSGKLSAADDTAQKVADTLDDYVFGTEYEAVADDIEDTEAGATLVEKLSHTTPSVPAGTYRIGWGAEVTNDSGDKECAYRFRVAGTIEGQGEPTEKNADDYQPIGGIKHHVHGAPGTITTDIYFAATGNGGTAKMRRARIEIWRVA